MADTAPKIRLSSLALRAGLTTAVWLLLAEGDLGSLVLGVPAIAGATYVSFRLDTRIGLKPFALLRFLPMFFWRSIAGAIEVALRALKPSRPLDPQFANYEISLPEGLPRVFFANTVSLLPGTLSADLDGSTLCIHLLDDRDAALKSLAALEASVATLFAKDGDS